MSHNVDFFKKINELKIFDIKLNEVAPQNFRIMTNDHVFPEFSLNRHFGLNSIMTKIDNNDFNKDKIIRYFNNLKEDNSHLYDNSESGLIFFGIFKDKNNELYACISSQLDQNKLMNFYSSHALDETVSNLEVRYDLLKKAYDPSVSPETYATVQQEYFELQQCKLNYLYANRYNYLNSLVDECKFSLENNLFLLNDVCKYTKLNTIGSIMILNHVSIKQDFIYYFVTELHNNSLIFYNLQEGFGLLENNNDIAFLIPSASFSDNDTNNFLDLKNIDIYEASILSRKNYNVNRFLKREEILNNISTYAQSLNKSHIGVKEINQFTPIFLYLI